MKLIPLLIMLIITPMVIHAQKIDTIHLEPYLQLTNGAFFKSLTLKSTNTLIDNIENFDYEWGYHYKIVVKQEQIDPALRDVSNIKFTLLNILEKVPTEQNYVFSLLLDSNIYLSGEQGDAIKKESENTYRYHDKITLIVPTDLQEDFEKLVLNKKIKRGTFTFYSPNTIRLVELTDL